MKLGGNMVKKSSKSEIQVLDPFFELLWGTILDYGTFIVINKCSSMQQSQKMSLEPSNSIKGVSSGAK